MINSDKLVADVANAVLVKLAANLIAPPSAAKAPSIGGGSIGSGSMGMPQPSGSTAPMKTPQLPKAPEAAKPVSDVGLKPLFNADNPRQFGEPLKNENLSPIRQAASNRADFLKSQGKPISPVVNSVNQDTNEKLTNIGKSTTPFTGIRG